MSKPPAEKTIILLRPSDAAAQLIPKVGSELEAKRVLADALHSGRLSLVADYVWENDFGDLLEPWTPRRRGDFLYEEEVEVEPGFFRRSAQWPAETNFWRWDEAEFVLFTSEPGEQRLTRFYLKGVAFKKSEINALIGRSNRSGGPKSDRERWAIFWLNVLKSFAPDDFDWSQFSSRHELKQAFLAANDANERTFSDGNIDFAVNFAWERLVLASELEREMPSPS